MRATSPVAGDAWPDITTGRIADVDIDPKNPNVWYVASASGGLFKTENRGNTFAPIFDQGGSFSLGAVKVDPSLAPVNAYLGVLGSTGLTAWAGLFDIAQMREGDVVFVSGAAGAVGSVAGQLAKLPVFLASFSGLCPVAWLSPGEVGVTVTVVLSWAATMPNSVPRFPRLSNASTS